MSAVDDDLINSFKQKGSAASANHRLLIRDLADQGARLFENNTYYNEYAMQVAKKKLDPKSQDFLEDVEDFKKKIISHFKEHPYHSFCISKQMFFVSKRKFFKIIKICKKNVRPTDGSHPKIEDIIPKSYFGRAAMKDLVTFL